jgi:hypothetical protein
LYVAWQITAEGGGPGGVWMAMGTMEIINSFVVAGIFDGSQIGVIVDDSI